MRIFLGNMELRQSEKPDFIQRGGGQHLAVFEFPGGNVAVQNLGSRYREVSWKGWFEGKDAYDRMIRIGNMRQKGDPVELRTEKTSGIYVIAEYYPDYKRDVFIPFSIKLQPLINVTKAQTDPIDKYIEKYSGDTLKPVNVVMYTVVAGDTLSKIAHKVLGNANNYSRIYEVNKDVLTDGPHRLQPGQILKIEG